MAPLRLHLPARRITSRARRGTLLICAAGVVSAAAAIANSSGGAGTAVPRAFAQANGPHVVVSALPGVDLGPVKALPGVSAASGPFPTLTTGASHGGRQSDLKLQARPARPSVVDRPLLLSGTWVRAGSVVLEQGLARTLGVSSGGRITVSSAHGPVALRIAGTAVTTGGSRGAFGYVTRRTLARLATNERTYGSVLYLRVDDPGKSSRYVDWIRRSYPAPTVVVEDWHRLQS